MSLAGFSKVATSVAIALASVTMISGCAAKPTETQVSSLADLQKFFEQYPYTSNTYVSVTPKGSEQIIEADTDSNGDGTWQDSDKPTVGRAKTSVTNVTIVETSLQLQVFLGFFGNGAGFSLESTPANIRSLESLTTFGSKKPVYVAVHETKRSGQWTPYETVDGPPLAFAYVKPSALAEYTANLLSNQ